MFSRLEPTEVSHRQSASRESTLCSKCCACGFTPFLFPDVVCSLNTAYWSWNPPLVSRAKLHWATRDTAKELLGGWNLVRCCAEPSVVASCVHCIYSEVPIFSTLHLRDRRREKGGVIVRIQSRIIQSLTSRKLHDPPERELRTPPHRVLLVGGNLLQRQPVTRELLQQQFVGVVRARLVA